ncbi:MAG TPA: DNA-processing protein DprA, partial [Gaiellaceae bacterium]|nr:DNA-processing protein DprA [Gaiellaceae bacterium]
RNRIVAGLAAVTVVVEARERSGALITADLALEEGREILAVPGEVTSALSAGTNGLLRNGAGVCTGAVDVLTLFGLEPRPHGSTPVGPAAADVLERLRDGAASADELARSAGLGAGDVARALLELELAGAVVEEDGVYRAAR